MAMLPQFTAHNIRLDDGTQTHPSAGFTMDQHPVTRCVRRLLHVLYPDGIQGKTAIDVGCLEGGFATELARMGMTVTGLEVRESNYKNCIYVRDRVDLPNLNFVQADANDIAEFGEFDLFFVSGLLYHLDRPRQFLEDVARNCRKALVLWTHITHDEQTEASKTYSLSDLCENENLRGRWYTEHDDIPRGELDQLKWASWSNRKSFWIQKEHLLQLLKDLGFDMVLEQFDCMDDILGEMTEGFYRKIDRVMLVAIKSGLSADQPVRVPEQLTPTVVERAKLAAERARIAEQAAAANRRALQAEDDLSRSRMMLEAVYASTSWRLTAPLRWIGSLLVRRPADR
jgi:cyclopropane fatty-acyl-phospholipid synthase-like methyltransferase